MTAPLWSGAPELPPLPGAVHTDVCVIGLGASGLAAVLAARERGHRVIGIDAAGVAAGAAGRNAGFLLAGTARFHHDAVAAYGHDRALALYRLTLAELEAVAGDALPGAVFSGSVRIAASNDERNDCAAMLAALEADDLPAHGYDGPEGRGVLIPTDGACDPIARCAGLAHRAVASGADLFGGTRAVDVQGTRVETDRGSIRCERVIVAVDGSLEAVVPELADRVRTARCQMLATAPTTDVSIARPVYHRYGYDYWRQLDDGRVVLGGCRDLGGETEWTAEQVTSDPVQHELEKLLRATIGTRAPVTHRWSGAVAFSVDGLPVLGEVRPGVVACGAYSGTGNVLGVLCGRAAAALSAGEPSELADLLAR